jgi:hypothetical protein
MKRFTDTELSDKDWFMSLSCRLKCVVRYLFDKCDNAGVWTPNYKLAAIYVGEPFTESEILEIDGGEQFEKFGEKINVKGFIEFQYGELSENCNPHKPIIKKLKKYNLWENENLRVPERVLGTLKEKEKDKDKDKDKDFEKYEKLLLPEMLKVFKNEMPDYFESEEKDFPALLKIANYISKIYKLPDNILTQTESDKKEICRRWGDLVEVISKDNFFKNYSIQQVEKHFQSICQKQKNGTTNHAPVVNIKQQAAIDFLKRSKIKFDAAAAREADNGS